MATSLTAISPAPIPRTIQGDPGARVRWQSPVPDHWLLFSWFGEAVTAGNATDDQFLSISCALSQGWAYLLVDLAFRIQDSAAAAAGVFTWEGDTSTVLTDNAGGADFQTQQIRCDSPGVINDGSQLVGGQRNYTLRDRVPQLPLIPFRNQGGSLTIGVANPTVNGPAATTTGFAALLAYNIEQAYNAAVVTPQFSRG